MGSSSLVPGTPHAQHLVPSSVRVVVVGRVRVPGHYIAISKGESDTGTELQKLKGLFLNGYTENVNKANITILTD